MNNKKINGSWYQSNESNTAFVFVHGFFSNSEKCWTSEGGIFWPDLIASDKRFDSPSIFLAGYYTDIDSGNYKIADCAGEVFSELSRPGVNGEDSVLTKENLVFVCHSLGGIVVRYLIEKNREYFSDKAVGIILMASPSYGSDYADKFSKLIKFYKNKIAAQLKNSNGSLQDLDERFKDLIQRKTLPRLVGAEAIEHHFQLHWEFLPGFSPVVTRESASRYFGKGTVLPNTNHSTCVKPTDHNHVSHKFLATSYIDLFLPIAYPKKVKVELGGSYLQRAPNALFEIYEQVDKPFYVDRQVDVELNRKIQLFSVWLFGGSGFGKTACTRHEVFGHVRTPIQVYVGALSAAKVDHVALLNEIYYTVCDIAGFEFEELHSSHKIIERIASMLVSFNVQDGVVLVIDEIPLLDNPTGEIPSFILSIINLISIVKRKAGTSHAGVILNSIFDPTEYLLDPEMKIGEQIKFLHCPQWNATEIESLVEMICSGLKMEIDPIARGQIIKNAKNSPRQVKTLFKDILLKKIDVNVVDSDAIRDISDQF